MIKLLTVFLVLLQIPKPAPAQNVTKSDELYSPYVCQGNYDEVVRAFSMLKVSAEQMEAVNENLNRELMTLKEKYESNVNYNKLQSDRAEWLYMSLCEKNRKLATQLQNDRRYAYELHCNYRELVQQMDKEQAQLNQQNGQLRQELESIQKELVKLNQIIQEGHGERDNMQGDFNKILASKEAQIHGLYTLSAKLRVQLDELLEQVKQQEDEITYLHRALEFRVHGKEDAQIERYYSQYDDNDRPTKGVASTQHIQIRTNQPKEKSEVSEFL